MTETNRPTLAELQSEGIAPDDIIMMINASLSMHGEYACNCGVHGDDEEKITACPHRECYFRDKDGNIDAPFQKRDELLETRRHYEALKAEAAS